MQRFQHETFLANKRDIKYQYYLENKLRKKMADIKYEDR